MKKIFFTFLALLSGMAYSQTVLPSNTYVRTCLNDIECSSINSVSYLFLDESRSRFYIKLDFNELKTGVDSVDFWLEDLNDTYLLFVASISRDQLPNVSTYNVKNIRLSGQLSLNNIWKPQTIDVSLYRAENDMQNNTTNANRIEAYKVNFSFSFSPKDFNIHKKPNRLSNTIFIGVGGGQINLLKAGMEGQLGDAVNRD
jgi:hypothetical protein